MSEATETPELSFEDRFIGMEKQSFVMYLQLNAITKLLLDKEIIEREQITAEMDALNQQLHDITQELMEQQGAEAEPAE